LYASTAASVSAVISTTIASATAVSTAAAAANGGSVAIASVQGIEGDTCCGMTLFFACDHLGLHT
jgi:hypothetical protein